VHSYESAQQRIRSRASTWLVTGAAGFIGSHLAEALLKLGQDVVALDNLSTGKRSNLPRGVRFIEGDIRSLDDCRRACAGAEVVLHQAALGSVPRSIDDPLSSHQSNIDGFVHMLVAARDAGVQRFVYASSSAIYGDSPVLPKVEEVAGKAISPYALTKQVNELYADVFDVCYGFKSIGLRYFNVFGARQDPNGAYASVIPAWIGALLRGQTAYVNGDGSIARDFCHVDNVVQANLLAATVEEPAALGQAYNVALGDQTTLLELFDLIGEFLQMQHLKPVHREPRPGDIPFSRADISKAQRLLGYRPAVRIREGLQKTVEWYSDTLMSKAKEAAHV
jgi:UDP-N-acetylglucosamine/UDP-N-acetylgalactosamine 4-epimerase